MAKVAQIGCGHWGKNLVRNFAEIDALAAVVDGDAEVASKMAADFGVPASSWASVLADDEIDAIALATPAPTHARLALEAIAAGKHVYVEKPLALHPNEAMAVIDAATKADVKLMVGHLLQYHPVFLHAKEMVEAGTLGKLRYLYSNRMSFGKLRTEENVLWSFAPHDFSMILSLAGEQPAEVSAQGAAVVSAGIADWCTTQFAFPSGVRGHVQVSWLHPFKEQRLVVIGDEGMLVFEDSQPNWDQKLMHYPHAVLRDGEIPEIRKADGVAVEVAPGEPLRNECQHFVDAIDHNRQPRTDGHEGLGVLKILHEAESQLQKSLDM